MAIKRLQNEIYFFLLLQDNEDEQEFHLHLMFEERQKLECSNKMDEVIWFLDKIQLAQCFLIIFQECTFETAVLLREYISDQLEVSVSVPLHQGISSRSLMEPQGTLVSGSRI